MDRYVLAKLRQYVEDMTRQLDNYEVANACDSTRTFLEVLTNWYVRRSRDRFWGENTDAFDTLWTVLETVCRVAAPLLPLTTEEIWRGLTGERSVHLTDWPDAASLPDDPALVAAMDEVRDVASAGLALRKAHGLRTRLPLASLTLVVDDASALAGFEPILADELNVKEVRLVQAGSDEAAAYAVEQRLTVNARAAGPRLGRDVQTVIKGSKTGDWSVAADGTVTCAGFELAEGEFTLETVAGEGDDHAATAVLPRGGFVVLDTATTPELEAEGVARDLVRIGPAGPPRRRPRRLGPDHAHGLRPGRRARRRPHARGAADRGDAGELGDLRRTARRPRSRSPGPDPGPRTANPLRRLSVARE